LKAFNSHR